MDVFITGDAVSNGGYVENNVFEKPWSGGNAFHFRNGGDPSPDPNNWDFRYNTFVGALSVSSSENPVGSGGMRVIGNVFLSDDPCGEPNTTYAYNAFVTGFGCGTNRITNSLSHLPGRLHQHRRSGHLQPQVDQRPDRQGQSEHLPVDRQRRCCPLLGRDRRPRRLRISRAVNPQGSARRCYLRRRWSPAPPSRFAS